MSSLLPRNYYILVVIEEQDHILLVQRKRGTREGKWSGIGGRILEGESVTESAIRHVKEDSGLVIEEEDLKMYGNLIYDSCHLEVYAFLVSRYTGVLKESEDYRFKWFNVNAIPYICMAFDDKYWLPTLLKRWKFSGHFNSNTRVEEDKQWL